MASIAFTPRRIRILAALFAVGIAAIVIDQLIVTETERIETMMAEMREAVEGADAGSFLKHVSRDFRNEEVSRDQLRLLAAAFFRVHGPVCFRRFGTRVNRVGNLAVVEVGVVVVQEAEGYAGPAGASLWQVKVQKEGDGVWRITDVDPVQVGPREVSSWGEVRRLGDL